MRATSLVVITFLFFARAASAQQGLYVSAGAGVPFAPVGPSDSPYLSPGLGGRSVSVAGGIGYRLMPSVAVGAEISLASIAGNQQGRISGGLADLERDHRLTFVVAVARVRIAGGLQLVGGTGLLVISTHERRLERDFFRPIVRGPFEREFE